MTAPAVKPKKPKRDWFTIREAADLLGVSITTTKFYIQGNEFPNAEKAGAILLIPKCDIDEKAKQREERSSYLARVKKAREKNASD